MPANEARRRRNIFRAFLESSAHLPRRIWMVATRTRVNCNNNRTQPKSQKTAPFLKSEVLWKCVPSKKSKYERRSICLTSYKKNMQLFSALEVLSAPPSPKSSLPKVRKFSLPGEPNRTLKRLPSKLQRQAVARARQ